MAESGVRPPAVVGIGVGAGAAGISPAGPLATEAGFAVAFTASGPDVAGGTLPSDFATSDAPAECRSPHAMRSEPSAKTVS